MTALGLTWDHPRGRAALEEIARRATADHGRPLVHWAVQPLEGFESAPIAELAAAHDLLVLDHPHIGEAVAEGCLRPLGHFYPPEQIETWRARSVGPSMASYDWSGESWALPLDVAAQVTVRRPDKVACAPATWAEVEEIAQSHPVALSMAGPHAVLTLLSLAAAEGAWPGGDDLLPDDAAHKALETMAHLWSSRPAGSETLNPIATLEAMARGEIALCPLIFGYVTYAAPGPDKLAFTTPPGGRAGVLGGTGLAFTQRAEPDADLLSHVASLMDLETQTALIPAFGGQPSARAAWQNTQVNADWGQFYADTLAGMERAVLRPRFDGYIRFQTAASRSIRCALTAGDPHEATIAALRALWRDARAQARGPLDDERGAP